MNYLNAFWVGGAICAICQIFIDRTKLTPARILVSLVVLGVFLQAVGVSRLSTMPEPARPSPCSGSATRSPRAWPRRSRRAASSACLPAA